MATWPTFDVCEQSAAAFLKAKGHAYSLRLSRGGTGVYYEFTETPSAMSDLSLWYNHQGTVDKGKLNAAVGELFVETQRALQEPSRRGYGFLGGRQLS